MYCVRVGYLSDGAGEISLYAAGAGRGLCDVSVLCFVAYPSAGDGEIFAAKRN